MSVLRPRPRPQGTRRSQFRSPCDAVGAYGTRGSVKGRGGRGGRSLRWQGAVARAHARTFAQHSSQVSRRNVLAFPHSLLPRTRPSASPRLGSCADPEPARAVVRGRLGEAKSCSWRRDPSSEWASNTSRPSADFSSTCRTTTGMPHSGTSNRTSVSADFSRGQGPASGAPVRPRRASGRLRAIARMVAPQAATAPITAHTATSVPLTLRELRRYAVDTPKNPPTSVIASVTSTGCESDRSAMGARSPRLLAMLVTSAAVGRALSAL